LNMNDYLGGSACLHSTHRLLHGAAAAHHCTLRLRTSAEFEVARAYGGLIPDDKYEGLLHVMRCGPSDCFAFDFDFCNSAGFGDRGDCPPTMQLAFEYTMLLPLPPREGVAGVDSIGRAVQVETRVCMHGIKRPSLWVSVSRPVRDAL